MREITLVICREPPFGGPTKMSHMQAVFHRLEGLGTRQSIVTGVCENSEVGEEQFNMDIVGPQPSVKASPNGERAPWLARHRWQPGQSGNPTGRPRESGSLSAALRRVGIKPAKTRSELVKIAQQLGMDPDQTANIDVIAGLMYDGITQLLIRTVKGSTTAGDKLVGLLQLLHKALDGDEKRITLSGPGDVQAALASVSAVLGFRSSAPIPIPPDEAHEP